MVDVGDDAEITNVFHMRVGYADAAAKLIDFQVFAVRFQTKPAQGAGKKGDGPVLTIKSATCGFLAYFRVKPERPI
jgi:hypothetical protein